MISIHEEFFYSFFQNENHDFLRVCENLLDKKNFTLKKIELFYENYELNDPLLNCIFIFQLRVGNGS